MKLSLNIEITGPIAFAVSKLDQSADLEILLNMDPGMEAQSYQRVCQGTEVQIMAADEAAAMYALLDVADALRKGEELTDAEVVPFMKNRGIKFNIPLDSRTPSYSDASTSATKNIPHMWEMSFWTEFLDRMAENKYNVLSLWSLSPFPSLVRIPEFPEACIDDVKVTARPFKAKLTGPGMYGEDHRRSLYTVKKLSIDDKIEFWRAVMQYAKDRCIRVYIFTWNLFVYGTEDSSYGITEDQNNPVTRKFVYCGTKALMDTYPLLAGIGVTAGENMTFNGKSTEDEKDFSRTDVGFIAKTYGKGIRDYLAEHPEREFALIHRMQMARYHDIMSAYEDFPCDFEISFKYSQAHMYSSTKPMFIQDFLQEKAPNVKIWLTVRNDDYYMMRWGNPEFAREYLANMPVDCMTGFYMGPDGFTWGRDYMTKGDANHPLFADKMWYMFKIWGQLAYNLNLSGVYFRDEIRTRFSLGKEEAASVYECWKEASQIIPELNCMHWHDFDFQWYPEGCCMYESDPLMDKLCFADINEFVSCRSMPGSGYASVREYAESIVKQTELAGVSPVIMADSILNHAARVMELLPELEKISADTELSRTICDMRAMSYLGFYYGTKEKAAMNLAVYRLNGEKELQAGAVELLKEAAGYWKQYSAMIGAAYEPQVLTRLCAKVNVQEFDELVDLDVLLAAED